MMFSNFFKRIFVPAALVVYTCFGVGSHLFAADSALDESWQCPPGIPAAEAYLRDILEGYKDSPDGRLEKRIAMDINRYGLERLDPVEDAKLCCRLNEYHTKIIADKRMVDGEEFYPYDVIYYRAGNYYFEVYVNWESASEVNDVDKARVGGFMVMDHEENRLFAVMSFF